MGGSCVIAFDVAAALVSVPLFVHLYNAFEVVVAANSDYYQLSDSSSFSP